MTGTDPTVVRSYERHFRTDHLLGDLKGRSVRGGAVTLSAQAVKFVLQIGSTAVLARLLTPADFGLIAMVATVTGFAGLFKDLGLSQATVQRAEITHDQVSTLFWINIFVSAVAGLLVAAIAPAVAWFYGEPRLAWVTVALGGTFIFGGLAAQHTALLQRQMRFGPLAAVEISSLSAGIATAVVLAMAGASYWALVGMVAVQAAVAAAASWMASGWWPNVPQRGTGVRPMLRFGGNLTGFNVLNYFTRNFDNVMIGAMLGSGPLGLYSKAYGLLMLPISQVNGPISSVVVPALSALRNEPQRYRHYFRRALETMTALSLPLVVFCSLHADSIILTILGPRWSVATPIFLALVPAAVVGAFNVAPGWLYVSSGRTRALFHYSLVAAPVTVCAMLVGLQWGAVGVAAGFSCAFVLCYGAIVPLSCKGTPATARDYASAMARPAVGSVVAGSVTAVFDELGHVLTPAAGLLVSGGIFLACYAAFWGCIPQARARATALFERVLPSRRARVVSVTRNI
jgi:O-antigen/teichoic acid export membrane protein